MKINNYWIITYGNINTAWQDIVKVAEETPKEIHTDTMIIATFKSALNINELTDFFKLNNIFFTIFELTPGKFNHNIDKNDVYNNLFKDISEKKKPSVKKHKIDVSKLSEIEKTELLNKILDKGVKNLSKYDKDLMSNLVKNKHLHK